MAEDTTPSALYARGAAENRWEDDPAQRAALASLDRIHAEFAARRDAGLWKSIQRRFSPLPVKGLYLWGSVGRGKTFLTDLLLESLPDLETLAGAGNGLAENEVSPDQLSLFGEF